MLNGTRIFKMEALILCVNQRFKISEVVAALLRTTFETFAIFCVSFFGPFHRRQRALHGTGLSRGVACNAREPQATPLRASDKSSPKAFAEKKTITLLPLLTSVQILFFASFCESALAQENDVVARIGNTDIKADEIRSSIESLDSRQQAALARDPNLLNQLVRSILVQRVVLNEALSKHWDQEPAIVAQLARVRDNTIRETYLASVSQPPPGYPSETELKAAYEANKPSLLVPRQFRLAQIYIALPETADKADADKAQTKLDGVKRSLHQKDADFAAIARAESDESQSAAKGGEIGWLPENQIQPEIRSQISGLTKGAASDPIRLADGWHLIKILDSKDPYTPSLDEVRAQLIERLRAERAREISQAYVTKLLQQTPVSINELALSKLLNKPAK